MRYSLRHLLIFTTFCALICAGYVRYRHLEDRAQLHERQAQTVAQHRGKLLTYSFHVPQSAWDDLDRQESLHKQIATDYRQQVWRPWVKITQPEKPLAMWPTADATE